MNTKKLFVENVYLRKSQAMVLSCNLLPPDRFDSSWPVAFDESSLYYRVLLDQTVFFPEGGGQSCDTGRIGDYAVVYVYESLCQHEGIGKYAAEDNANTPGDGGRADNDVCQGTGTDGNAARVSVPRDARRTDNVWQENEADGSSCPTKAIYHIVCIPKAKASLGSSPTNPVFHEGQEVTIEIDWMRRFDNMQRHCGEHILSGIFHKELGGVNRGFHMGENYMTIDISLETLPANPSRSDFLSGGARLADSKVLELTTEDISHVEAITNHAIWENLPVTTRRFDSFEAANALPLRKALSIDEDITVVCVGSVSNPSDCVACCGTHPTASGQVGLLKIYKFEKYKGMYRIYFDAGNRALNDFVQKQRVVDTLCYDYSATPLDLLDKVSLSKEKHDLTKKELTELKAILSEKCILEIKEALSNGINSNDNHGINFFLYGSSYLKAGDLPYIGKQVSDSLGANPSTLLALCAKEVLTLFLFAGANLDCRHFIAYGKENFGGKGGGSASSGRISFDTEINMTKFTQYMQAAEAKIAP